MGPVGGHSSRKVNANLCMLHPGEDLLVQQMNQFLNIDGISSPHGVVKEPSIKDQYALKKMRETTELVKGQYQVGIVWKAKEPWMPNNWRMAESCLASLKRKLQCDWGLRRRYTASIAKLIKKGYACKLEGAEA